MARTILHRFIGMLVVMLIVVTISFVITRVAPGDPAAVMLGPSATAQDIAALHAKLGLDRPLPVQYVEFLRNVLRGDLGWSIFLDRPVTQALAERAEPTVLLTLMSIVIAALIGLPVGIYAAYRRGGVFDQAATALAMLAASVPGFWLGLILIQTIAVRLGWLPVSGYGGPGDGLAVHATHLVLPAVALGLVSSSLILRVTRASMLDVLDDDYVRTARSKGMGEMRVVMRHAFRNALIPVLTVLGLTAALLVSGAVVTETVFGLPGMGSLVVSSVLRRDYPVIQGALLVIAALYVLFNFVVDMLYLVVDPRVRY
jgi:peptide/nickel transport system permease protein